MTGGSRGTAAPVIRGSAAYGLGDQEARIDERAHVVQRVRGGNPQQVGDLLVREGRSSTSRMMRSRIGDARARISCWSLGAGPPIAAAWGECN